MSNARRRNKMLSLVLSRVTFGIVQPEGAPGNPS